MVRSGSTHRCHVYQLFLESFKSPLCLYVDAYSKDERIIEMQHCDKIIVFFLTETFWSVMDSKHQLSSPLQKINMRQPCGELQAAGPNDRYDWPVGELWLLWRVTWQRTMLIARRLVVRQAIYTTNPIVVSGSNSGGGWEFEWSSSSNAHAPG